MKFQVTFATCESKAVCVKIVPEVFEVREDGFLYILDELPIGDVAERVRKAARACPTKSILVVED